MNSISTSVKKPVIAGIIYWIIVSFIYSVILTAVLKNFNLTIIQIISDTAINNLLITAGCVLILNNLPGHEKYWYVLAISTGLSSICLFTGRGILWLLFRKDAHYIQSLVQSGNIRFGISFLLMGCMCMMSLL